jgi:RNA polymerase sigma-70 factor (ECF subfamily)
LELYHRYGPALLRKATRLLQNQEDARDVVQGLFIDLVETGELSVSLPYLYRAITRRCLNLMRDEKNRRRLLEQQQSSLRGPVRVSPDAHAMSLDALLKLSASVPDEVFETVVCRFYDEMELDEIAEHTGVSRRAVSKRLERAREVLLDLEGAGP